MGLDDCNESLVCDLRIEDVENNLAPSSEDLEQHISVDLTPHFVTEKNFDSREELILWAQDIAIGLNTVVVIAKSDAGNNSQKPRLLLGCERGGVFRSHQRKDNLLENNTANQNARKRKRSTGSKKCNCPFKLRGVICEDGKWKVQVVSGLHNHPLSITTVGHSYAGRLKGEDEQLVEDLTKSGVKPKEILSTLKLRNKYNKSTSSTIYNAQKKIRSVETEGRSAMQQVMKLLYENNYLEWHHRDPRTDEVLDMFWAHPESIKLAKCFPTVILLDCTYKTNRFKRPLLQIVGVASTNKTFCIGFAFLTNEFEENYSWALYKLKDIFDSSQLPSIFVTDRELALIGAIYRVFPRASHLLCTWHIIKNITGHCKKSFLTNDEWAIFEREWTDLVYSSSKEEYANRWKTFEEKWNKEFSHCVKYIEKNWLPWKEQFVCAWTNKVRHFGSITTARVEGAHSRLKKCMNSSKENFTSLWHVIHRMIITQITAVIASFEHSLIRVKHAYHLPTLRDLRGYISHHALNLILGEIKRSYKIGIDKNTCGCLLRLTHGLPCAHEIADFGRQNKVIPLSACDSHWSKLSIAPTPEYSDELDGMLEIKRLIKRLEECNDEQRKILIKKIRELADPETTWLNEPLTTTNTKGRPPKLTKKQRATLNSTKRDKSKFEYAKTVEDLQSIKRKTSKKPRLKKPALSDLSEDQLMEQLQNLQKVHKKILKKKSYKNLPGLVDFNDEQISDDVLALFNPNIKELVILSLEDVGPDGHCGFRACAELLGKNKEDGWKEVRTAMLIEFREHKELYTYQLGGENDYKELEIALDYFSEFGCKKKYWMGFPEMGPVFATAFNCVLCVLSPMQSFTYLPLRLGPPADFQIVPIILYEDFHFMKVILKRDAPIPKVVPWWYYLKSEDAARWEPLIKPRCDDWEARVNCP